MPRRNLGIAGYVELRLDGAYHMRRHEYDHAQMALDVAGQFWRDMTPAQRERATRLVRNGAVACCCWAEASKPMPPQLRAAAPKKQYPGEWRGAAHGTP